MADSIMSKAATMEIPINSNGDTGNPEDDSLEQVSLSHFFPLMLWLFLLSLGFLVHLFSPHSSTVGWFGQLLSNHAQACNLYNA